MRENKFFEIDQLCSKYEVEVSFFEHIEGMGLIEFVVVNEQRCLHHKKLNALEKILRLHKDLEINMEGIDVIFNLLEQIDTLQAELVSVKNQLKRYQ